MEEFVELINSINDSWKLTKLNDNIYQFWDNYKNSIKTYIVVLEDNKFLFANENTCEELNLEELKKYLIFEKSIDN